ncbi:MAG: peptidylprolyl isomerase [Bacteroidetes bacterium]|nr:peptidylprolyl isomerase [Bacteroidota bacterium]
MKRIIPIIIILIMTASACNKSDDMLSASGQLTTDIAQIKEFLLLSNLTAHSTSSGLHYIINSIGVGEDYPTLEDSVIIEYTGFYITDGDIFDQTEEDEPVTFLLGSLIPGWQEGIQFFKRGSEGVLLLPSALAYGPYPPTGVRQNAVMVFYIKVHDFF